MDGGTWGPAAGFKWSGELGLDIKDFLRERNGAAFGVDAEVSHKTLDRAYRR
jgi:hypothetical protein